MSDAAMRHSCWQRNKLQIASNLTLKSFCPDVVVTAARGISSSGTREGDVIMTSTSAAVDCSNPGE